MLARRPASCPRFGSTSRPPTPGRFKVGVQDNGPGILKKQIPLIFGKLLYGSKFHRLRMSRGQQGIGISAAGMYGVLTTGKPVKIISKVSKRKPAHYYEIQIDTKKNHPEILNGGGDGVDIPPGDQGAKYIEKHEIEWIDLDHGTRVTIELEAKYQRGRGSVDEYLAADGHRQSARHAAFQGSRRRGTSLRAVQRSAAGRAQGDQAASLRHRAGHAGDDAQGHQGRLALPVSYHLVQPGEPERGPADLRNRQA